MKKISIILIFLIFIIFNTVPIYAVEDPVSVENNKFGIHITDENDLEDAGRLVNSSGGDWGYVTLVIREDERNDNRWQRVFDRLRRLHLIPIIRTATTQGGAYWTKPDPDGISDWVNFFDSLNWVTKNRYIVIGNEVNHATEWGAEVNPVEYGDYFLNFSKRLKVSSGDYFVMMAGLDASAPNNKTHMSEEKYLTELLKKYPKIFENTDGWVSHSYPNPDFSSVPSKTGQIGIRAYEWELSLLRRLGVAKKLPVFVTETGWAHKTESNDKYLDSDTVNEYYKKLFEIYSEDSRIVAFTPFILNYTAPPFDVFSWKDLSGRFYPFYEEMQKVLKVKGQPHQITKAEIFIELIPEYIKKESKIYGVGIAKNIGQSIWTRDNPLFGYDKEEGEIEINTPVFTDIEPGKIGIIFYRKI